MTIKYSKIGYNTTLLTTRNVEEIASSDAYMDLFTQASLYLTVQYGC